MRSPMTTPRFPANAAEWRAWFADAARIHVPGETGTSPRVMVGEADVEAVCARMEVLEVAADALRHLWDATPACSVLTPVEHRIVELIEAGDDPAKAGQAWPLAPQSVKTYLSKIKRKTGWTPPSRGADPARPTLPDEAAAARAADLAAWVDGRDLHS